jgi:hypothetical protein
MRHILSVAAVVVAAMAAASCSDNGNSSCTSYCFQLNGIENDSPTELDAKIKKACEGLGRNGTPQISDKTKNSVTGFCPA